MSTQHAPNTVGTIHGHPLPYWIERLGDPDRTTAQQAQQALQAVARLSDAEKEAFAGDVPALLAALAAYKGRYHAWQVLLSLGPLVLPHLPAHLDGVSRRSFSRPLADCLLELARRDHPRGVPILLRYLLDVHTGGIAIRNVAISARSLGTDAAALVPHLEAAFGEPNAWADREIARTLGVLGSGVPTLLRALKHNNVQTRRLAVESLARIKDPDTVAALAGMLADRSYPVAASAGRALAAFGPAAVAARPALEAALASRSQTVRAAVKKALAAIGPAGGASKVGPTRKVKVAGRMKKPEPMAASLLQAIRDEPCDDAPRLICADWLEEHGDPDRAEFIRVQCELARSPAASERRTHLLNREKALLQAHRLTWLAEVPLWAARGSMFQRGFVASIGCTAREFLKGAAGLFKRAPVQSVHLRSCHGQAAALAECPWLARLTRLKVSLGAEDFAVLAFSPHLANLTALELGVRRGGDESVRSLVASPHLNRLTSLILSGSWDGPDGAQVLGGAANLANLTVLHLGGNRQLGDAGIAVLARSPHLGKLEDLGLTFTNLTDAGAITLADSPNFPRLRKLQLHGNRIGPTGTQALAASPHLRALETLDLTNNPIGDEGALALARSSLPLVSVGRFRDLGAEATEALTRRFPAK